MQAGVVMRVGTQVMGPEVLLKGLTMARNVARQRGESIDRFTTAVFDLTASLTIQQLGETGTTTRAQILACFEEASLP